MSNNNDTNQTNSIAANVTTGDSIYGNNGITITPNPSITIDGTTPFVTIPQSDSFRIQSDSAFAYPDVSKVVDLAAEKLARRAADALAEKGNAVVSEADSDDPGAGKKDAKKKKFVPFQKKDIKKEEVDEEVNEDPKEETTETPEEAAAETPEEVEPEEKKKKSLVAKATDPVTSVVSPYGPEYTTPPLSVGGQPPINKIEPEEVNYRLSTGVRNCATCRFFITSGAPCVKVDFPIDPNYTCNLYVPQGLKSLSMIITKASVNNGERRWAATASDTDPDQHGESCTEDLFKGFMQFFERSDTKPFLGVAHYPRMSGKGVAGTVDNVYMDGKRFKAKGTFADNELGDALFNAVAADRMSDRPDKIRISLAWWDLAHTHGDSTFNRKSLSDACQYCNAGKPIDTYKLGYLDHLAATRVPVNTRTELSLEMKSMAITRKDDAASIVDEILANQLEADLHGTQPQKALVIRSNAGLPPEAFALVPDKTKPDTWKVQIWQSEAEKVTPAQLAKAIDSLSGLPDTEKSEATKVLRSEYRTLGVKPHEWPEVIRPEFPALASSWSEFSNGVAKLAVDADAHPYIAAYVKEFKSQAFAEIEPDLDALETMVEELTQKSEIGENMDEIQLDPNNPYDAELLRFKSDVDDIEASDMSTDEKAAALKEQFSQLGEVYVATHLTPTKSQAPAPALDVNALALAFGSVLEKSLAPMAQQIALLNERVTTQQAPMQQTQQPVVPAGAPIPDAVPQRKSVAFKSQAAAVAGQPPSVSDIARKTVIGH